MKKSKGQALVEFVIILPIFLMLVFCVIDFGRIISLKSTLENVTNDVITFYENGSNENEIKKIIDKNNKDVDFSILVDEDYTTITLKKTIKPITPGFNLLPSDVFEVETNRTFKENNVIVTTINGGNDE